MSLSKKINFTNEKLKNQERVALMHIQTFGLREAGFNTIVSSKEESEQLYISKNSHTLYSHGVYNFLWNDRKYSIRIAPYKEKHNGLNYVDRHCLYYLWCENGNKEKMNDAIELNNYLKHYGVGWSNYIFGNDKFDGYTPCKV